MPHDEQFYQDWFCHPRRLGLILTQLSIDWVFDFAIDVINQEVSFGAGRIDVLATFNARKKLVFVEVKAGYAGMEDMRQLENYLDRWKELPLAEMGLGGTEPPFGLLVAEGFIDIIGGKRQNTALVQVKLDPHEPFRIVQPDATLRPPDSAGAGPRAKISGLYRLEEHHVKWIEGDATRQLFRQVAECFIDASSPRKSWLDYKSEVGTCRSAL